MAQQKKRKTWWIVGISAVVLLCLAAVCIVVVGGTALYPYIGYLAIPSAGSKAPEFKLISTEGETLRLSEQSGQPVVLVFAATWCDVCNDEALQLQGLHILHPDMAMLMIDSQESLQLVQANVEDKGFTFPVLLDPNAAVRRRYGVNAYPSFVFIDDSGTVQFRNVGSMTNEEWSAALPLIGIEP